MPGRFGLVVSWLAIASGMAPLHELPERAVATMRQKVGMVFQQFNLFPHMTALQNIAEAPIQVKR